ncbi:MAG TPA: hypothetical protein VK779_05070 [Rhizomicrobium sp.]|nr:hypothetical protein [Rhizomicrobium sp.]
MASTPAPDLVPLVGAQRPSPYSIGAEGKITFVPQGTDWVMSAAVRYGRSQNARHMHQQTSPDYPLRSFVGQIYSPPGNPMFGDAQTEYKESHLIVDFQAGKDFGLGLFGASGKSIVSAGVRFAQFTSSSDAALHARPEYRFGQTHHGSRSIYRSLPYPHYVKAGYHSADSFRQTNAAFLQTKRNTHAIGPSVSWAASLPMIGTDTGASLHLDWGINAAVLFGRQRTRTHHQTTGHYYSKTGAQFKYHTTPHGSYVRGNTVRQGSYAHGPFNRTQSHGVTIPNLGGFAGVSLQFPNAKVSLGYRADFFFNATDNGIDAREAEKLGFYGPFATVALGL